MVSAENAWLSPALAAPSSLLPPSHPTPSPRQLSDPRPPASAAPVPDPSAATDLDPSVSAATHPRLTAQSTADPHPKDQAVRNLSAVSDHTISNPNLPISQENPHGLTDQLVPPIRSTQISRSNSTTTADTDDEITAQTLSSIAAAISTIKEIKRESQIIEKNSINKPETKTDVASSVHPLKKSTFYTQESSIQVPQPTSTFYQQEQVITKDQTSTFYTQSPALVETPKSQFYLQNIQDNLEKITKSTNIGAVSYPPPCSTSNTTFYLPPPSPTRTQSLTTLLSSTTISSSTPPLTTTLTGATSGTSPVNPSAHNPRLSTEIPVIFIKTSEPTTPNETLVETLLKLQQQTASAAVLQEANQKQQKPEETSIFHVPLESETPTLTTGVGNLEALVETGIPTTTSQELLTLATEKQKLLPQSLKEEVQTAATPEEENIFPTTLLNQEISLAKPADLSTTFRTQTITTSVTNTPVFYDAPVVAPVPIKVR